MVSLLRSELLPVLISTLNSPVGMLSKNISNLSYGNQNKALGDNHAINHMSILFPYSQVNETRYWKFAKGWYLVT